MIRRHHRLRQRWNTTQSLYGAHDEATLIADTEDALDSAGYRHDANEDDCNRIRRWGAYTVDG